MLSGGSKHDVHVNIRRLDSVEFRLNVTVNYLVFQKCPFLVTSSVVGSTVASTRRRGRYRYCHPTLIASDTGRTAGFSSKERRVAGNRGQHE